MPEIVVRPPTPDDFVAVTGLLAELGRPALRPETQEQVQAVYDAHLRRPDTAPLVAEVGGQVVGFLSLEFRERLNREALQAWIPDLIVTSSAQGQGVGKALLQRAIHLARERGCWSLTLESGHPRKVAHQFYKDAGMRDAGLYFMLELGPGS
ncbi:MAG TPA: GNAT family N-acetyltransferase [Isosphaeraceae bacterium]|jgi:GNAT superfamily N-acetyltransferase|nr:GNAT family N-acetyltransferase [Isosphaeraceae bacterium]